MLIGGFVFFIVALVKAIKTGRKGWIIAASITGLPVVVFFGMFLYGMFIGFTKASARAHEMTAAKQGEPSGLLTAVMSPVAGRAFIPYTISLPWEGDWSKKSDSSPYDYLFSYRELYIGVIVEGLGAGSSQKACEYAQKNMRNKAPECSFTEPKEIKIGDLTWASYDAAATISNIDFKYRVFVYSDKGRSAQIICWTGPVLFERFAPVMNRIAESFRFTEATK